MKSKRGGTVTPHPQREGSLKPLLDSANRSASPLSSTRHSRLQEKAELQSLNDRLACYIDRVQNLETENARLSIEVQTTRETIIRESSNIKSMYENELRDARLLLDEIGREKAKLEIDTKRLWNKNDELKIKLDKKTKECSTAEGNARMYETSVNEMNIKFNEVNADRKKVVEDLNDALKDVDRLQKQCEEIRRHLEDETLARVDLENGIQSLREELTFKDQIHMQEINEASSRRQIEISEIDGRLTEQYETKLQQSLQELRNKYEAESRNSRSEIEKLFENKIRNLQITIDRNSTTASSAIEDLRSTRIRNDSLNARIGELETDNKTLISRIRELETLLDQERARCSLEISNLETDLQHLRDEMALQLQDYQYLMDIKVSLDLEIAAYDKLLCGEETRLNITPKFETACPMSQTFAVRATTPHIPLMQSSSASAPLKRKRTESENLSNSEYFFTSNAKGDVQISEVDPNKKLVIVKNKGSKDIQIGGWQLIRTSDTNKMSFKFPSGFKISAGGAINIWSMDAGIAHEPPTNIVMKAQKWFLSDNMKTTLFSSDGLEIASSKCTRRTGVMRSTHMAGINSEEIYHQQGDPQIGEEKCRLM